MMEENNLGAGNEFGGDVFLSRSGGGDRSSSESTAIGYSLSWLPRIGTGGVSSWETPWMISVTTW